MCNKRIIAVVLTASLMLCGLSGCGAKNALPEQWGVGEHEALNFAPLQEGKMQITVRAVDGMPARFEEGIEEHFPDVDIVVTNITQMWKEDMSHGNGQDIIMTTDNEKVNWNAEGMLIDLSGESYLQNYYLASLQTSGDGEGLYWLPGPSNIYGIVYNRDMFAEHGWKEPATLDEFITLCETIEGEGIRAIQPSFYYRDAVRQFFTGFTYEPVFAGVRNSAWHDAYRAGQESMTGHMEPAFALMQRLFDAGIIRAEDFEVQPRDRTEMMYHEQSCAMILETQNAVNYCKEYAGDAAPEIGMLPFFSGNTLDSDYLLAVPAYYIGASTALKEPGNEERLAKVQEILAYLSTAEGQQAIITEDFTLISSIRGVSLNNNEFLSTAASTIEKGHVVNQPFFVGASNTELDTKMRENLILLSHGEDDIGTMMTELDEVRDQVLEEENAQRDVVVIGEVGEDFTTIQTAQLFADIFRERAGTQIGLCRANSRHNGCGFRLYQGEIALGVDLPTELEDTIRIDFSAALDDNGPKLMRLTMTGENLLKSLPKAYWGESYSFWVASGLKITFAPWAGEGERVLSVTLEDGTEIDPAATYTIAVWNGSLDPDLIQSVEEYYEDTAVDLFRERVEREGSIKPLWDEYFILDWTVVGE